MALMPWNRTECVPGLEKAHSPEAALAKSRRLEPSSPSSLDAFQEIACQRLLPGNSSTVRPLRGGPQHVRPAARDIGRDENR
jgi:hypothetical protein